MATYGWLGCAFNNVGIASWQVMHAGGMKSRHGLEGGLMG